jgi:signal peptide peptidase SppA
MHYSAVVRSVYSSVWAILPEKLEAIAAFVHLKAGGGMADPETIQAIHAANQIAAARAKNLSSGVPGSVVVLPIYGIINQRYAGDFSGPSGTSVQQLTQQFRQAVNDPNVTAIVFDVDSPGGSVSGVDELAQEICDARKQKKIIAVSNCLCASAAYYLASQASEMVVSPSSLTGSIGVYQLHEDDSKYLDNMGVKMQFISAGKYKVEGNGFEPLDDGARQAMQGMVDDYYGMFTKAVARGRGASQKAVLNGFGEGRVLTAQNAVKQGLADRVDTLDGVLAGLGVKQNSSAQACALGMPAVNAAQASATGGKADEGNGCTCECDSCQAGDCSSCTHEGCDPEEEGCVGCGMADSDDNEARAGQRAKAEARARRLRLAAL